MAETIKVFACPKCGLIIEHGLNPCPYCKTPIAWEGTEELENTENFTETDSAFNSQPLGSQTMQDEQATGIYPLTQPQGGVQIEAQPQGQVQLQPQPQGGVQIGTQSQVQLQPQLQGGMQIDAQPQVHGGVQVEPQPQPQVQIEPQPQPQLQIDPPQEYGYQTPVVELNAHNLADANASAEQNSPTPYVQNTNAGIVGVAAASAPALASLGYAQADAAPQNNQAMQEVQVSPNVALEQKSPALHINEAAAGEQSAPEVLVASTGPAVTAANVQTNTAVPPMSSPAASAATSAVAATAVGTVVATTTSKDATASIGAVEATQSSTETASLTDKANTSVAKAKPGLPDMPPIRDAGSSSSPYRSGKKSTGIKVISAIMKIVAVVLWLVAIIMFVGAGSAIMAAFDPFSFETLATTLTTNSMITTGFVFAIVGFLFLGVGVIIGILGDIRRGAR